MTKPAAPAEPAQLEVRPVTSDRWTDLAELFGERGASSGCWCMWFRVTPKAWQHGAGAGNRAAMSAIVAAGEVPGLLAYRDGKPVGWVSVAPRRVFERIVGPPQLVPEDRVWSIVCFFIGAGQRGRGVAQALLGAAVDHARANGAKVLEAYPVEREGTSNADAYTGPRAMFEKAGFREVGRFDRWRAVPDAGGGEPKRLVRPPGRPVMQLEL